MSKVVSAEFCLESTEIESVTRPDVFIPIMSSDLFSTSGDVQNALFFALEILRGFLQLVLAEQNLQFEFRH